MSLEIDYHYNSQKEKVATSFSILRYLYIKILFAYIVLEYQDFLKIKLNCLNE